MFTYSPIFHSNWLRRKQATSLFILLFCWLSSELSYAQCSGCTSTVTTNTDITFTANGQVICLAPASALTYNKTIYTNGFTNIQVCLNSNVTWNGGNFNGSSSNFVLINNGLLSANLAFNAGFELQNNAGGSVTGAVTFYSGSAGLTNAGSVSGAISLDNGATLDNTGSVTGPFTMYTGSSTNNYGTFTPSSINYSGGDITNYAGATATIPGTTVNSGSTFINNGTLTVNGSLTNNGTTTLAGTTTITGNLTNNGSLNITNSPTIGGNVTNNGSGTITGTGSATCNSLCPTGTITNYGTLNSISTCKSVTGSSSNAYSGGTIAGSASGCSGSNSGTLTLSGQNGTIVQWESSANTSFSPATPMANTTTSQSYSNLTATTYYRAVISSGSCGNLYSTTGTITVTPQTIATSTISGSPFCAGATVSVGYTVPCSFTSGNVFTAQLSDAAGSFASPTSIGTLTSTASGTISATIPAGTATGTGYRIRVVGSNPAVNGSINGANLTINAKPTVTVPANMTVCKASTVSATSLSSTPSGASYAWTNNNTAIGLAAGGSGNVPSFTAANSTTSPITATITVTPTLSGCAGTASTYTITVYPAVPAAAGSISGTAALCQGQSGISYSVGAITNATAYTWAYSGTGATINGTGNAITIDFASNATSGNLTVKGTNICGNGTVSANYAIAVNANPTITSALTGTACSGSAYSYTITSGVSGATFTWSRAVVTGISNAAAAGSTSSISETLTNTTSAPINITYVLTPTGPAPTNCGGTASNLVVTVNPKATITSALTGTACSGSAYSYTITSGVSGATFAWSRALVTGISNAAAAGSTSGISETLTNTTSAPVSVTYVLTPSYGSCTGTASNLVVTVNPKATITSSLTGTVCSGSAYSYTATSGVSGATFAWSRALVTGISNAAATGSGATINETLINTTTASVNVTYVLTPTFGSCTGTASSLVVTVKPMPTVTNSPLSKTICSGNSVGLTLTSGVTGTTYAWSGSVISGTATGVTASSTSNVIVDNLVNTGTAAAVVRYVIIPTANGCPGNSVNYDVTVNPTPTVTNSPLSKTICSGSSVGLTLTSGVSGTTFTWTASVTSGTVTGFTASGSSTTISHILTNTTANAGVVRYVITPTANSCPGTPYNYDVTVNPLPSITLSSINAVCTGATSFSIPYSATTNGADQYSLVTSGASPMPGFVAVSNVALPASPISVTIPAGTAGTYTFTLTVTNSTTSCPSTSYPFSLSVGPAITSNTIGSVQNICADQTATQLTGSVPTGGVGTLTYLWESSITSPTTGFAAATGTNNTQNYQPAFATQNTWYRRTVTDACAGQNVSATVSVAIIPTPGDPTVFGNGAWNVYAYDNYNITANTGTYRGYYSEPSLSFDSGTRWNTNTGSPSDASGYQGCPVAHDNMGAVYKQTGFDGNTYQIDIAGPGGTNGHDDDAYLFVNGVQVWGHAGCCDAHTNVWIGILKPTTTVEFRWKNGSGPTYGRVTFTPVPTPTSINPGLIGYNETICPGNIPSALFSAAPASGGCYPAYQWQIATDLTGSGNWTNIAGATALTYVPTAPATQTTYFRRVVTDACDLTAATPTVTVAMGTTAGNPALFGNGIWNVYGYDGGNGYGYTNPLYLGYYVETSLNFDSRNRWTSTGSPSDATGYQGCQVPIDFHVVSYRRQNFTSGTYQLDIPFHDDNVYVYINGALVFSHIGCCDAHTNVWTGPLDASSTVELKWIDTGGGGSVGALNLNIVPPPTALVAGSVGSDQTVCPGEVPAVLTSVTPASGGCYPLYQWQVATDISGSGNWTDISGATAAAYTPTTGITQTTYYRRAVSDACGNTAAPTAYLTVTMGSTLGDPTVFGNNTWNVYAYSYTGSISAPVPTYLGYYVEPLLTFNSTNRWNTNGSPSSASGYQGCQVGVDYHIVSYKRQGFPAGNYQLDITTHDDNGYLYINGTLVFSHIGCCDAHTNVWTGTLNASSTVEFTWREGSGGSNGGLQFTSITPTIPLSAGAISTDQAICNSGDPAAFTSTTDASSSCTVAYQWQSSLNNSTWVDVAGATASAYDVPAGLTQTTYYRRGATDACGVGPLYTNVVTVTVYQALTAGSIATAQTICTSTTPAALTSTALPTGANGSYSYSWQSSTNGTTWSANIAGATGTTYAPGSLTVSTYFRRTATTSCTPAATASTTPVLITVTPLPAASGAITGSNAVCQSQNNVTYTVPAFANATSYTWAYSATGASSTSGSFTTAANSITLNFSASATSGNLTVRGNNGCGTSATLTLAITVNSGAPGAAGAFTAGLSNPVCQGATGIVYSLNANVTNATSYTWTLPTGVSQNGTGASGTVTTTARSIAVDFSNTATSGSLVVRGTNGCGNGTTNSFAVTVNALIANNTVSATQTICSGQTPATLTGTTPTGGSGSYTYLWQSSPDNTTWATISGATSASYVFPAGTPTTSTWYRRVVSTTGAGCSNNSAGIQIIVNPAVPTAAGTITGTASICQGATGIVYSIPTITNANSYIWTLPTGAKQSGTGLSGTISTASNTLVLDFPSGSATGNLTVYGSNTCGNGTVSPAYNIVVSPAVPGSASTISGANTVCQGQTGVAYSVAAIANATSYSWSVPAGATITSGANTNAITVDFSASATSGNISVNGVNGCGSGVAANYALTVNPLPSSAGTITGATTVCQAQSGVTYTVPAIANATSYLWTYSATGVSPSAGTFTTTTNSLTVDFSASATSGNFTVTGSNACGNGAVSATYAVTVKALPVAAGSINGSTAVCQSQTGVVYTVPVVANATSYVWALPSGANIVAGIGTNSITINFSVSAASGNITVYGKNSCGNGAAASLAVTVSAIPAAAGTITGTAPTGSATAVCRPLNGVMYTVPVIAGATSYYWTLPTGVFSTTGSNVTATNSITVDFNSASAASGNVTVYGNNSCGNGTISSLAISVSTGTPGGAGTITGTNAICRPNSSVTYTVPAIGGATSYTWTLPTGVTQSGTGTSGTVSTTTNTITVDFGSSTAAGNNTLSVKGINACGVGSQSTYTVTVYTSVPTGTPVIAGSATVCQAQNGVTYTVSGISSATSYTWTLPTGATPASGTLITASNTITVNYSTSATSGNLTVTPTNPCGNAATSSNYAITVNPLPDAPGSITGISLVCQNTSSVMYTIPVINNATQYVWSLPSGVKQSVTNATGVVTIASNSITVDFTSTAVSGNITVNGKNGGCGNGPAASFAVTVSTPGTWLGGTSDDWNDPANWCGGVPSWTTTVTITTATAPGNWPVIRNTPTAKSNHLIINPGTSVTISGNYTLDMKGNLNNYGTFTLGSTATVNLSGNATQALTGITTFNNLTVSGGGTKTLSSDITVNGILALQSGLVSTGINKVNVTNSAPGAVTSYTAVSYVDGNLQRAIAGSGSYDWPVGAGVKYAPINLNIPAATPLVGPTTILGFFVNATASGAVSLSENGNNYTTLCGPGYWTLTPDVQPSSGNFDLVVTPPSGMTCSGSQSTLVKRPNSAGTWGFYGSTAVSTTRRNGFVSFSEVTQATGNSVSLPVRLLDFSGEINNSQVALNWTTLTELDNAYFDVERSSDARYFEAIGRVKGSGTTNERNAYHFTDAQPLKGIGYYRLRQVDTDGNAVYSKTIAIHNTESQVNIDLSPNPIRQGAPIQLKIESDQSTSFTITLCDLQGRVLHREAYPVESGVNQVLLNSKLLLPAGLYIVRATPANPIDGHYNWQFKLVIE